MRHLIIGLGVAVAAFMFSTAGPSVATPVFMIFQTIETVETVDLFNMDSGADFVVCTEEYQSAGLVAGISERRTLSIERLTLGTDYRSTLAAAPPEVALGLASEIVVPVT